MSGIGRSQGVDSIEMLRAPLLSGVCCVSDPCTKPREQGGNQCVGLRRWTHQTARRCCVPAAWSHCVLSLLGRARSKASHHAVLSIARWPCWQQPVAIGGCKTSKSSQNMQMQWRLVAAAAGRRPGACRSGGPRGRDSPSRQHWPGPLPDQLLPGVQRCYDPQCPRHLLLRRAAAPELMARVLFCVLQGNHSTPALC